MAKLLLKYNLLIRRVDEAEGELLGGYGSVKSIWEDLSKYKTPYDLVDILTEAAARAHSKGRERQGSSSC